MPSKPPTIYQVFVLHVKYSLTWHLHLLETGPRLQQKVNDYWYTIRKDPNRDDIIREKVDSLAKLRQERNKITNYFEKKTYQPSQDNSQ